MHYSSILLDVIKIADLYPRLGCTCGWDAAMAHADLAAATGKVETLEGEPLGNVKGDLFVKLGQTDPLWSKFRSISRKVFDVAVDLQYKCTDRFGDVFSAVEHY